MMPIAIEAKKEPEAILYCKSSDDMSEMEDNSVQLTVTSPPYWNAIDYDKHAKEGSDVMYRKRDYDCYGDTFENYIERIGQTFSEVLRITAEGGFCAIVVGTILQDRKHYPAPMMITSRLCENGWEFHQDIIWHKVTGGVKRAGSFIQHRAMGYFYPNIMTEYILIFRKPGPVRRGRTEAIPIDDLFKHDIANSIWHIAPVPPGQVSHPCPYPLELVRRLVLLYSDEWDMILDPFLGSGQTAVMAKALNRNFVGYDIEEAYIRLSNERLLCPQQMRKHNLLARFEKVSA